jgi:hypothetical protein
MPEGRSRKRGEETADAGAAEPEVVEPAPEPGALQRREDDARPGSGVSELARAFQLNAEILRRIQETQKDIAESLERSDRSEMVIRSADSLNETFRGVRSTQKALMSRIEETRSRHGLNLIILAVVGLLLAGGGVLGARWLVRSTQEEAERRVGAAWEEDRRVRDEALARVDRLRSDLEEARRRAGDAEREQSDLAEDLATRESELAELRKHLAALETMPRQLDELRAEIRVREDRIGERDARIVAQDRELLGLHRKVGELEEALRTARSRAEELTAELARREGLAPPGAAPRRPSGEAEIPDDALTNPGQLDRLRGTINGMLALAAGEEHYQIDAIRGVSGRRLLGVEVRNVGFGLKLRKTIRAERLEIALLEKERRVELRFEGGTVEYAGTEVGFLNDRYVVYVAGVDPAAWRRAGLTLLQVE